MDNGFVYENSDNPLYYEHDSCEILNFFENLMCHFCKEGAIMSIGQSLLLHSSCSCTSP